MSYLKEYIDRQNMFKAALKKRDPRVKLLTSKTAQGRKELAAHLSSDLSPENLMCDGEISATEGRRKYRFLSACAGELLAIDPSVRIEY